MAFYYRALKYTFPLIQGEDVLALQRQFVALGFSSVGQPDGIFGRKTDATVRTYQQANNLLVDGIVGPRTWNAVFKATAGAPVGEIAVSQFAKVERILPELTVLHSFQDSVLWQLRKDGLVIGTNKPEVTSGEPATVKRVWGQFGDAIDEWAEGFGLPVELIVATICTESGGDPTSVREEPGYISDEQTPNKVSPGLMQTLISTARATLGDPTINRHWLLQPNNSIRAGASYINSQFKATHFDPPKVACAYNAGNVYYNSSANNRWKMRQFPIGTSHHADRFIQWFNDCFRMFEKEGLNPEYSFYRLLRA